MISPSLFGGRRLLVVRNGQDARKDLVAALLDYAKQPDPDVMLVVTHTGGGRAKALADGLRTAGADVVTAAKLKSHRERVAFVREELRRGGTRGSEEAAEALLAAVGNDLRDLSAACSQLLADVEGRIDAATVARYYRGRAEVSGFTVADAAMVGDVPGGARGAALGAARRRRPGADRRRHRRRRPHGRAGGVGRARQRLPDGEHAGHAGVEDRARAAPGPRLDAGGARHRDARRRRLQRRRQGRCRRPGVRPGARRLRRRGRAVRRGRQRLRVRRGRWPGPPARPVRSVRRRRRRLRADRSTAAPPHARRPPAGVVPPRATRRSGGGR